MKKKEREHLKEDPFQLFIEHSVETLRKFKKQIFIGIGAVIVIILVILLVYFLKSGSITSENRLYSKAMAIRDSTTLGLDQKIAQLSELNTKGGISADIKLFLAALYFEKGDMAKAKETLDKFSGSKYRLINDKKLVLEADILNATGNGKEALETLSRLFSDAKSEITKDFLLLKMARIQVKTGQTDMAAANLKKINDDYPQSIFNQEVQTLLNEIETR
ncbi:MAG: Tetratricopeptide repeat protein [Acidobacteriota bacterium]|nr:Tetratricopeptide repeat protein [Acidobacteriota bacterium]